MASETERAAQPDPRAARDAATPHEVPPGERVDRSSRPIPIPSFRPRQSRR